MIVTRRAHERGHAEHGWLHAFHTFSFADYHDPAWMGFGALRVLNHDRIEPGRGFGEHGHRDMEIVTYVLDGVLEHRDDMGNASQIRPGEVQLMSAGTGVRHSEFNGSPAERTELLQIWIIPARRGAAPRYEQRMFPPDSGPGFRVLVSPDGRDGSLTIGQDACMLRATPDAGAQAEWTIAPGRRAWLHVVAGRVRVGDVTLGPADAAGLTDTPTLTVTADEPSEVLLFDLP
jgi:redox-sensitive bicupin YhaK (pirin superfamily)